MLYIDVSSGSSRVYAKYCMLIWLKNVRFVCDIITNDSLIVKLTWSLLMQQCIVLQLSSDLLHHTGNASQAGSGGVMVWFSWHTLGPSTNWESFKCHSPPEYCFWPCPSLYEHSVYSLWWITWHVKNLILSQISFLTDNTQMASTVQSDLLKNNKAYIKEPTTIVVNIAWCITQLD